MATILLTGFAPFNQEKTNPSWQAVKQFEGKATQDGSQIHVAELPCEFGRANEVLINLIQQTKADTVICLGQAGGRPEISVERVAINIDDARIPDNAGIQPIDQPIQAVGQNAYFSSLPIKAIVHNLRQNNIPAQVSQTAGTFVCNHVFYGLMHYAETHHHIKRAGFIHIPYLPEQAVNHAGAPSMSLETLLNSIKITLEVCTKQGQDLALTGGSLD
ncbi:pyroglutamyl-peptidase I [Undibacterium sp. LX40W]|uniref:Pyrrolidone-carboxylate peptidase n=1 Tax=Undibacterium nitidum TaxID=2762298 RepID=A0A923HS25_9BURK|nr:MULTISPECIES: pyroglutamyl-peptidase I [Undibacterium]MBC3881452.1 pyroglutamyl-peptidase I [Undibacterium nitidum]MBC3891765.1 pyroglutamyl-peptidase I [Undibacterium sp. LX40W]